MSKLIIYKNNKKQKSFKPAMLSLDTYEKVKTLQQESGLPMTKLIDICVNYAIERLEVSEAKPSCYDVEDDEI